MRSAFLALTNCLFKKHTPFITTIFINDWFWSVLYLFSSFWTLFLEWKGCNSIYHFRSDGVPMRKVSPGNPSPLMERKNQNTQNLGRLTKMFTERFDEVIFEPLLLIDNLVYLFIIFLRSKVNFHVWFIRVQDRMWALRAKPSSLAIWPTVTWISSTPAFWTQCQNTSSFWWWKL